MRRRLPVIATAAALALVPLSPAFAATAKPRSQGLRFPIRASSTDQGSFEGILKITRFATVGGQPAAVGTVVGTLTDESGVVTGIVRNVALAIVPAVAGEVGRTSRRGDVIDPITPALNVSLAPVELNVSGLAVHVDQVTLDIVADDGPLGAVLGDIAGLLGSGSALDQVATPLVRLLNRLLTLLG